VIMKRNTHPFLIETTIQNKDGSVYKKRWLFFRSNLPLEVDVNSQSLWKKSRVTNNIKKDIKN
jgi:hypothetical protein